MGWTPFVTVVVSTASTFALLLLLYGLHSRLVPYLRESKHRLEPTLPYMEREIDSELKQSLYSLPTLNYIDPRNSISDSELCSTRWSTCLTDLSCPTTPKSTPRKLCSKTSSQAVSNSVRTAGRQFCGAYHLPEHLSGLQASSASAPDTANSQSAAKFTRYYGNVAPCPEQHDTPKACLDSRRTRSTSAPALASFIRTPTFKDSFIAWDGSSPSSV